MIDGDSVVAHKPALHVEVFDDAMLVWDEETQKLHHLEVIASSVWDELDGHRTLGTISETLADRYATEPEQIRTDVLALVTRLHDEGLLVTVGSDP